MSIITSRRLFFFLFFVYNKKLALHYTFDFLTNAMLFLSRFSFDDIVVYFVFGTLRAFVLFLLFCIQYGNNKEMVKKER